MKTDYAVLSILIAISFIAVAACGVLDSGDSDTSLVDDRRWMLESMDGNPPIDETFLWLRLDGDSSEGFDGCNTFGGQSEDGKPVAQSDGTFLFPSYFRTNIGCGDIVNGQSDAYIDILAEGRGFRMSDGRLEILDESGVVRLMFVEQSPLPGHPANLSGTAWRLMVEEGAARPATLVFLNDHWATGVTACRGYIAGYHVSAGRVDFPSLSMTETGASCPNETRRIEGEFTTDLSRSDDYSIHDEDGASRLYLRTSRGRDLVFESMGPAAIDDIADREWRLRSLVEDRELGPGIWSPRSYNIPADSEVTLSFHETTMSGLAECHSFEAPLSVEGSRITIGSVAMVERDDCENYDRWTEQTRDYIMEQVRRYLDLLPRLESYQVFGDRLFIHAGDKAGLLFEAK